MSLMTIHGYTMEEIKRGIGNLDLEQKIARWQEEQQQKKEAKAEKRQRRRLANEVSKEGFWHRFEQAKANVCLAPGNSWHLQPRLYVWGRLPASYCAFKAGGRAYSVPRDQRIPIKDFWPSSKIPEIGIQFASTHSPSRE